MLKASTRSAGRTFDELSLPSLSLTKPVSTSAQPPLALSEERVRAQNGRQLGYAHLFCISFYRVFLCGFCPNYLLV